MEAKDKALRLVSDNFQIIWKGGKMKMSTIPKFEEAEKEAKQCALIAVDTILEDLDDYLDSHYHEVRIAYWEEVKKEIDNL